MPSRAIHASSAALFVLIFVIMLVVVYLTAMNHDMGWDLSRSKENTLDSRTRNILSALDFDIRVTVFDKPGRDRNKARELLDLFALESPGVHYELIHPDIRPGTARRFGIDRYGRTVIAGKGRQVVVDSLTEESFANALLTIKQERKKNIYVTCGHGEPRIDDEGKRGLSSLASALRKDGYRVSGALTIRLDAIPRDADLLMVAGPRERFTPEEIQALREFIYQGGNILIALEPFDDGGLKGLLDEAGIVIGDDLVVDPVNHAAGGEATMPVVSSYGSMEAVAGYTAATVFPTSRSLGVCEDPPAGASISRLARTSEQSWAEHDPASIDGHKAFSPGPADQKGPLDIALLALIQTGGNREARVLAFGDADFLTNTYFNVAGNRNFAMNCINAVLDQGYLISLDEAQFRDVPFVLTPGRRSLLFWVPVVVVPSLLLSFALVPAWKRRRA